MPNNITCRCCEIDTEKRIVLERFPLQKIHLKLPDGFEEFYCHNIIKVKRIWVRGIKNIRKTVHKWHIEECRNNIIIKNKKRKG